MFQESIKLIAVVVPLEEIKYVDHPEIKVDEHESTQMPFRYVLDAQGQPILPKVINPFLIVYMLQAYIYARV